MKRGPKSILTKQQQFDLGAECETAWRKLTEKSRDRLVLTQQIREIQASNRKTKWEYLRERESVKIDALLKRQNGTVARGVSLVRPYGAADRVLHLAVAWCWRRFRKKISTAYARDCWDYFRKCEKRIVADLEALTD